MGGGDFIAQMVEGKTLKTYEFSRTVRFTGCGMIVFGPGMHFWYSNLDRLIKGPLKRVAVKKLFLDQGFFLPVYLGVFVVLMAALRGEKTREIRDDLDRDYAPMLMTSYAIWPPVQAISFICLPGQFRVLLINVVGLFWNTYLSWKAEEHHHPQSS